MASLAELVEKRLASNKTAGVNSKAEFEVMYSTGFLSIDYLNGTSIWVESPTLGEFSYDACGIVDGSTNTIIGRSGSGKSTLLLQIASNIAHQNDEVIIYIDDIEGSLPESRKHFLLGFNPEEFNQRVRLRDHDITTENLYQRIQGIHDEKIAHRKELTYDTGYYDMQGNRIFKMVPTLYLVDSLPMLMPESLTEDEELGGSMSASSIAKTNTMLFKKISQLCKDANIIFFTINHILEEIQMGFITKAAQISGLKPGERLPGGRAAIYLANNMFRVDDSKTLKADSDYGIDGSIIEMTLVKSRTNTTKKKIYLIFDKTEGKFDNELSLYHLLKTEGKIEGTGQRSYFECCPDVTFSAKTFKSVLASSVELQEAFVKTSYELLSTFLSNTKSQAPVEESQASSNIKDIFHRMATKNIPVNAK